jgi:hypothetical protein
MQRLHPEAPVRHKAQFVVACAAVILALSPVSANAQRHHRGGSHHVAVVRHSPLLWGGVYGGGFYHPYYLGFAQWYPYPYPVFGFPGGHIPDHVVSLRLQVTPRDALVYVDGYAAGTVDDYDGVFQRLRLIPGPHEIVIYHRMHRTLRQNVYYNPGSSHTIRHTLDPLQPGDTAEPQPVPRPMPPAPGMLPPQAGAPVPDASRTGTLALRVQPADAAVLIDGEPWQGPASPDRLVIQLPEGSHRVRVEKPGYQSFVVDVDVRAGETASFNVSLIQ